jgi:hypothetical protein
VVTHALVVLTNRDRLDGLQCQSSAVYCFADIARVSSHAILMSTLAVVQEANLWRKLKSKDIVQLVGIGAANLATVDTVRASICVVCEHMDGGTLREAVEQQMMSSRKQVYRCSDVFRCAFQMLQGNHVYLCVGSCIAWIESAWLHMLGG